MGEGGVDAGSGQGKRVGVPVLEGDTAARAPRFERPFLARRFEHRLGAIDADDVEPLARELEGEDAGAGSDVGDAQRWAHEGHDRPGAQQVVAEHTSKGVPIGADLLEEIAAGTGAPARERAPQESVVAVRRRIAVQTVAGEIPGVTPRARFGQARAIGDVGSLASIGQKACLTQDREMARDAGLGHAQDRHQLTDEQLLLLEQSQDPHPGRIGEGLENLLQQLRGIRRHARLRRARHPRIIRRPAVPARVGLPPTRARAARSPAPRRSRESAAPRGLRG